MKWNPAQVSQLQPMLSKPSGPALRLLVLHGNDESRLQAVGQDILLAFKAAWKGLEHQRLEAQDVLKGRVSLADTVASGDLFGGRKLVEVSGGGESMREILQSLELAEEHHPVLVRMKESLTKASKLRPWLESNPQAVVVGCYAPEAGEMQQMIRQALQAEKLEIAQDALVFLAHQLAQDAAAVRQEVEKLALYKGGQGTVTIEDVMAVVPGHEQEASEDVLEALLQEKPRKLTEALARQEQAGVAPVALVRGLMASLARLSEVQTAMLAGAPLEQAAMKARPPFFFKQHPMLKANLSRWPLARLQALSSHLLAAEPDIKRHQDQASQRLLWLLLAACRKTR